MCFKKGVGRFLRNLGLRSLFNYSQINKADNKAIFTETNIENFTELS
jgi:hypothetical protein